MQELTTDLETFHPHHLNVDDDFVLWFSLILKHLNIHAPIKTKRVKTKRLPYWFTPEIAEIQKRRDTSKRLKRWDDYRKFIDFELKKVLLPPLGNFADISYLEENFKPHLLRDVCTLCSGALVSDSLLHMLL